MLVYKVEKLYVETELVAFQLISLLKVSITGLLKLVYAIFLKFKIHQV